MAQVMVNFRIDEDVKKSMEQACKEMGLSMTSAFTIFATKVGKEKRIPFEITAEPPCPAPYRRQRPTETAPGPSEEALALTRTQERLEQLCPDIRQSLTIIHTAIPASITGLTIERIRMLCGDELKDKAAESAKAVRALSGRNAQALRGKDLSILDEYAAGLSSIALELRNVELALVPSMKMWSGGDATGFIPYKQQLEAVSQKFDALPGIMQRFLCSAARDGGAGALQAKIRQAARSVRTPYVLTALDNLGSLVSRCYDGLEDRTKAHLESEYLQTLGRTLEELEQAERAGGDAGVEAALCLRTINVLSQAVSNGGRIRQEWDQRSLEAEVTALERLAAMRGDVADGMETDARG